MNNVYAHSAADCNGVSGDSSGQRMSQTDVFTRKYLHTQTPSLVHRTRIQTCIVGVLVQTQTLEDCGTHLHTVMHMRDTYKHTFTGMLMPQKLHIFFWKNTY